MRSRLLRVAAVVMLVVAVLVAGLAVLTVVTAPLVIALELAALAVVTGVATHRRRSRRRRATAPSTGGGAAAEPEWTTGWPAEPSVESVATVRERLALVLSGWGLTGEDGEPTQLVVTELLDNVITHGRGPTRLAVRLVAGGVRVEVSDGSPELPRLGPPDPTSAHGHGLVIVDGLARQWGWTDEPPGKTVWAVVPPGW
jgi:anti-sigma regulatory factor (Ser/Thr protein kinase)